MHAELKKENETGLPFPKREEAIRAALSYQGRDDSQRTIAKTETTKSFEASYEAELKEEEELNSASFEGAWQEGYDDGFHEYSDGDYGYY